MIGFKSVASKILSYQKDRFLKKYGLKFLLAFKVKKFSTSKNIVHVWISSNLSNNRVVSIICTHRPLQVFFSSFKSLDSVDSNHKSLCHIKKCEEKQLAMSGCQKICWFHEVSLVEYFFPYLQKQLEGRFT